MIYLNHLGRGWMLVAAGDHRRHVNGILGLLCRLHFSGLVAYGGGHEPAYTWDHYITFPDVPDRDGRVFRNKAERVTAELWVSISRTTFSFYLTLLNNDWIHRVYMQDFFRCQDGYEAKAAAVAHKACVKLVKDMHYEARIQAIVTYHATYLDTKITKTQARTMTMTREEYLQVNIKH